MKLKKFNFINFKPKSPFTQKTWLVILMGVCVYYTYSMFTMFGVAIFGVFYSINSISSFLEVLETESFMLFSLFITCIAIVITILYVKFLEKRPLSTIGIVKKGLLQQYGIGYLLGILMIGVPTLALLLFNGTVTLNANANYGLLALYFLGFIVQGASEEIMMRGYLFTSLAKTTNMFWAIFISSFGFALLHLINPNMGFLPFINLVLFGVFACFFFLRTKNIWAICAIHAAWNFFQGNVFGIQVSGQVFDNSILNIKSTCPEILSGGAFGLEGGLLVTALLVVATLITVFGGNNKLVIQNDLQEQVDESI